MTKVRIYVLSLDFIPGEGTLSGSCYKAFTSPETWNDAKAICISLGAQLVKIESAEENDFLTKTFLEATSGTYWIGLSDQVTEGEWIWTDGSLLENYNNWGRNNPNNKNDNQDCGHILSQGHTFHDFHDGEWNDLRCSRTLGYLCEQHSSQ